MPSLRTSCSVFHFTVLTQSSPMRHRTYSLDPLFWYSSCSRSMVMIPMVKCAGYKTAG